jgi:hypothetical protein
LFSNPYRSHIDRSKKNPAAFRVRGFVGSLSSTHAPAPAVAKQHVDKEQGSVVPKHLSQVPSNARIMEKKPSHVNELARSHKNAAESCVSG